MDRTPGTKAVTVRLPSNLLKRIRALRGVIADRAMFSLKTQLNRSDIVRYLLLKGVEALEREAEMEASGGGPDAAMAG